jgi:hypothetical protein
MILPRNPCTGNWPMTVNVNLEKSMEFWGDVHETLTFLSKADCTLYEAQEQMTESSCGG